MVKNQRLTASLVGSCQNGTGQCPNPLYTDRYINVYFLKKNGASGSRAHPTFSARPAGQSRFAYTCGILYPPLNTIDIDFGIPGGIPILKK
jgi:hypothetical protein